MLKLSPNSQSDQDDIESFSEIVLHQMKKKLSWYLFALIVTLVLFIFFTIFISFNFLPFHNSLFFRHARETHSAQLSQELRIATKVIEVERTRFATALNTIAHSPLLTPFFEEGDITVDQRKLHNLFSSISGSLSLDFYFVLDQNKQVLYCTGPPELPASLLEDNTVIQKAFLGTSSSFLCSEEFEIVQLFGLAGRLQENTASEAEETTTPESTNMVMLIEGAAPISVDNTIKGIIFGASLINKNTKLLAEMKRLILGETDNNAFLAIVHNQRRVAATLIPDQGSVESTFVSTSVDQKTLQKGLEHFEQNTIMNSEYYLAYIPLADDSQNILGAIEIGVEMEVINNSYFQLLNEARFHVYLTIMVLSLLFLASGFVLVKFADQLFNPLKTMTQRISVLISKIASAASKINKTSTEILASSEEQSAYSSQQAASINETTATMEELATVTKQIANYAEQVVQIAQQTTSNAEKGYQSVLDTVSSMKEIKKKNEMSAQEILSLGERSQKIGQVMRIINNIASQTKLIAFNASIEASAAGDIGKRFGVVATEVRRLADNVVQSTDEIKKIITEIQKSTNRLVFVSEEETKKIDEGVLLSENSGEALKQILQIVSKTNQAAKQISLITQQQRTASDQVVTALKEISHGASESVKSNKIINTAISDLDELSDDLSNLVGKSESLFDHEKK